MTKPGYQISFSNADNVSAWGGLALWAQFLEFGAFYRTDWMGRLRWRD